MLPLGGLERRAQGLCALALLVEALTGRALAASAARIQSKAGARRSSCRIIDPAAFGGSDSYARQMDWLVDACHDATAARPGVARVALRRRGGVD